jgi:signal transduction histidine kinase/DNA-binding NarL/FixJ family response regulator
MANKNFIYLIIGSFLIGTVLLIVLHFNFLQSMRSMRDGNRHLLKELRLSNHLREVDRDILGVESRIRAAIATGDTSHLQGIDAKINAVKAFLDSLKLNDRDGTAQKRFNRLNTLALEKIKTKDRLLSRYFKTGNMQDTSFIANPRARRISDEITTIVGKIYDDRQTLMVNLSNKIASESRKARIYGNLLMAFMLISGGLLTWFIIAQFRLQYRLIFKLDKSEKTALEALQIKENFLANMSHEIRTPLNSILGFTNLLKRRNLDAESGEFVGSIQSAGENLLTIINDILDLSKIEAGMMRIVNAPFSVSGLLQSLETLFQEKIKQKGLVFNSEIDSKVPDTLVGDATRLTQILVNLIGNALKFSDKGKIKVYVYCKEIDGKNLKLGFQVSDNGIGIDKEKLVTIFERFNQAEDSITRNYGGTGLGLSIVKTLVLLQHGNISVSSIPGHGTTFDFYIPYTIADEQLTDINQQTDDLIAKTNQPLNILVVDDNAMNQSLMKHLLTEWKTSFDIVGNGIEAINRLKVDTYDLVLMDIQMPQMDGYTATRHIRSDLKLNVPIIAMTAHAMAGEREKCISNGMNEYIPKPIREEDLFKLIAKLLPSKLSNGGHSAQPKPADYKFIDLTYMRSISKGNLAYEKTVTSQFIEAIPADLSDLRDALNQHDYLRLSHIAHNMKTSVAIMGLLPRLENVLDSLEAANAETPNIVSFVNELVEVCKPALGEAADHLSSLS